MPRAGREWENICTDCGTNFCDLPSGKGSLANRTQQNSTSKGLPEAGSGQEAGAEAGQPVDFLGSSGWRHWPR